MAAEKKTVNIKWDEIPAHVNKVWVKPGQIDGEEPEIYFSIQKHAEIFSRITEDKPAKQKTEEKKSSTK